MPKMSQDLVFITDLRGLHHVPRVSG